MKIKLNNKNRLVRLAGIFTLLLLVFISCVKDSDEPEEENTTTTPPAASPRFTWTVGNAAGVTADDAGFVTAYNNIYATKSGGKSLDIILEDLSEGTHTISPSTGITLQYSDGSTTYNAKSGTVVITKNTGALISGNYNCSMTGGGTTVSISGDFSELPKK